jgi:NRPS condensation-like uncharacterized protein
MKKKEDTGNNAWLRLDNAARIYPAIRSDEVTAVFRVSVTLKERIRAAPFLEAVHAIEHRFPYYKVRLRKGFFWYYLQYSHFPLQVGADLGRPCRAFHRKELMFRVLARDCSMSVEFSHILTDATGAFEFLKSLLLAYCERTGIPIPTEQQYYRPGDKPAAEEYEDAYRRYFKRGPSSLIQVRRAFHLPFPVRKTARFRVLTVLVPMDEARQRATRHGVSLTEYLVSVYLFSLQRLYEELPRRLKRRSNRIIRIEVPVNLRRILPSATMRNFTLYVLPEIDLRLGHYTFEEITKTVYHQMRLETDPKLINKEISRNVGSLNNDFVRRVPLFIKSFVLSRFYAIGTGRYSGVVTNLGKIDISPAVNERIDHFRFIAPPPNRILKVNCGVVGFGNHIVLNFGNITSSMKLEGAFLDFLENEHIHVQTVNAETETYEDLQQMRR